MPERSLCKLTSLVNQASVKTSKSWSKSGHLLTNGLASVPVIQWKK